MKQKYISCCDFCDEWFWGRADCEQHEETDVFLQKSSAEVMRKALDRMIEQWDGPDDLT